MIDKNTSKYKKDATMKAIMTLFVELSPDDVNCKTLINKQFMGRKRGVDAQT